MQKTRTFWNRLAAAAMVGAGLLCFAPTAEAQTLLTSFDPDVTGESAAGSDSIDGTRSWAFKIDVSSTAVTAAEFKIRRRDTNITTDLTVAIMAADGLGLPDGVPLASAIVPVGAVPTTDHAWIFAALDFPVPLGAGDHYVVLSAETAGDGEGYEILIYVVDSGGHLAFSDLPAGTWTLIGKPNNLPNRIWGGVADSDGDGVPDEEDAYPNSDASPTLVVGGVDLGIPNAQFDDGATMADLLGAALTGGGNTQGRVAQLLNAWKVAELISGQEQGRITAAVATSSGGRGR